MSRPGALAVTAAITTALLTLSLSAADAAADLTTPLAQAIVGAEAPDAQPATLGADPEPEAVPEPPSLIDVSYAINNTFLLLCAVLVLFMQAGFAMVAAGLNSQKNAVNILFKNLMDVSLGALLFWFVGYNIMYPADAGNGWFAWNGNIGIGSEITAAEVADGFLPDADAALNPQIDWLFQTAFAATAATIVAGAVAGRMKFSAYLIYSTILTGLIYPISGMWKWGGGWLDSDSLMLHDFAGSLVVHVVGGFAGLAGAIALGPRRGRYAADGTPQAMPGHNLSLVTLGVFILWIGWYGFNPGSQLAFSGQLNTDATMLIAVNTTLAAAAGAVIAMFLSWQMFRKPDLTMALNGLLAGLVGITANCDQVTNGSAIIIGGVAGVLVVLGIVGLDKLRIDDPIGAFPVHGICGIWGGLATGIFGTADDLSLTTQVIGCIVYPLWAFVTMYALFMALKTMGILRVSAKEEDEGLDISEHGMQAYIH